MPRHKKPRVQILNARFTCILNAPRLLSEAMSACIHMWQGQLSQIRKFFVVNKFRRYSIVTKVKHTKMLIVSMCCWISVKQLTNEKFYRQKIPDLYGTCNLSTITIRTYLQLYVHMHIVLHAIIINPHCACTRVTVVTFCVCVHCIVEYFCVVLILAFFAPTRKTEK